MCPFYDLISSYLENLASVNKLSRMMEWVWWAMCSPPVTVDCPDPPWADLWMVCFVSAHIFRWQLWAQMVKEDTSCCLPSLSLFSKSGAGWDPLVTQKGPIHAIIQYLDVFCPLFFSSVYVLWLGSQSKCIFHLFLPYCGSKWSTFIRCFSVRVSAQWCLSGQYRFPSPSPFISLTFHLH